MPKTTQCTCTEKTSKQQKSRCRSKRECKFPPQQTGRKAAIKKPTREVQARYDGSDKGKQRKARYKRKEWAKCLLEKVLALPVYPRVRHLSKREGHWSPPPVKSAPMVPPVPTRKCLKLPPGFWRSVLERRKALIASRKLAESEREFRECARCHWLKNRSRAER